MHKSVLIGIIISSFSFAALAQSENWVEPTIAPVEIPQPSAPTEQWLDKPVSTVQASDQRLVIDSTTLEPNVTKRLPRRYGFTRGATLPLIGAAGDSISTYIALKQPGIVEKNGLVNTSPIGILAVFALKTGLIYYMDQQEPEIRKSGLMTAAGLWNGVTVSNIAIAAGASNPIGLLAGLAYGVYSYYKEGDILAEEEAAALGQGDPMFGSKADSK